MTGQLIILEGEIREDGSVYICSPNVSLFHVVASSVEVWKETAIPIMEATLSINNNAELSLYEWEDNLYDGYGSYLKVCGIFEILEKEKDE